MRKRGLGKGLSELGVSELFASVSSPVKPAQDLVTLPLSQLKPGKFQPRRKIKQEALEELANSIRAQGIIIPIVVRAIADGGYEIIAGERRWRAAQLAGLNTVPVLIREFSDEMALAVSLIENIQRQDLNIMEEAVALERLIIDFQMTHAQVATAVGKSRASVTNTLRLLRLNEDVRNLVEDELLDMGHARALLALEGSQQSHVAALAVDRAMTVRETETFIRRLLAPPHEQKPQVADNEINQLQESLSSRLKTTVSIKHNPKGRGKLIISYNSINQLDDILQHIN